MSFQSLQHFSECSDTVMSFAGHRAAMDSALMDETLLEQFDNHFDAIPANTLERVRTAQRIRHQVYCIEHPHEQSNDPDGLERDEFDAHAAHSLLMHRATNTALGTVRLVLPVAGDLEHSFPVQRVLDPDSQRIFNQLPLASTAEVSRFSISRQLRRSTDLSGSHEPAGFVNNSGALMRLGLIQALVRMSLQHGITHWCAAMEPTLLRMLSAMAIRFRPVGPLVEYHGLRQPCYCVVADILDAVRRERPSFWAVLTDGGALSQRMSTPVGNRLFELELAA
jgi:N-acyl amino acid synthase of PEP-CTERM/exosortase system